MAKKSHLPCPPPYEAFLERFFENQWSDGTYSTCCSGCHSSANLDWILKSFFSLKAEENTQRLSFERTTPSVLLPRYIDSKIYAAASTGHHNSTSVRVIDQSVAKTASSMHAKAIQKRGRSDVLQLVRYELLIPSDSEHESIYVHVTTISFNHTFSTYRTIDDTFSTCVTIDD